MSVTTAGVAGLASLVATESTTVRVTAVASLGVTTSTSLWAVAGNVSDLGALWAC